MSNIKTEELSGNVSKILFKGNNCTIGVLDTKEVFVGGFLVSEGESIILHGAWDMHPQYGKRFKASSFSYNTKLDKNGLIVYITNNKEFKGIGEKKARLLVDKYYDGWEDNLITKTDEISRYIRVHRDVIEKLANDFVAKKQYSYVYTVLSGAGISPKSITKLIETYGNGIIGIIQENIYSLIGELVGFGFKKIDEIALKMGYAKENEHRIKSAIRYTIKLEEGKGHCWISLEDLVKETDKILLLEFKDSSGIVKKNLKDLLMDEVLVLYKNKFIANRRTYEMEQDLWDNFQSHTTNMLLKDFRPPDFDKAVFCSLNELQRDAFGVLLKSNQMVISGPAGSGKSYLINAIRLFLEQNHIECTLTATTGKAAKVVEAATGRTCMTLHRMLGYKGFEYDYEVGEIKNRCIIVDEFSMATIDLIWHLYRAVDLSTCTIIFVGDHKQLPPVGLGNILRDILDKSLISSILLKECVRQSGELKENCFEVLKGHVKPTSDKFIGTTGLRPWYKVSVFKEPEEVRDFIGQLYDRSIKDKMGLDVIKDVQLITPTHKGVLGTVELNLYIRKIVQKNIFNVDVGKAGEYEFFRGDKVIHTTNNYRLGVMNGEIGIVREVIGRGHLLVDYDGIVIEYDPDYGDVAALKLCYATTVHKSQGDAYNMVIFICHKSHSYQHNRNLMYTALTRGRMSSMIVGDLWSMTNCARKVDVDNRRTFLKEF